MTDTTEALLGIVDCDRYPLTDPRFHVRCKSELDRDGVLTLEHFLVDKAIDTIRDEGLEYQHLAYFTSDSHNIYLKPDDSELPPTHPRNRKVTSSKGCITDDQIPRGSALRTLYHASAFRGFLCSVLDITQVYEYADPLSSINLHYADEGQELGWHFDNSSFAITLMIQRPKRGGTFEYVKDVRNADSGEMNYELTEQVLNGQTPTQTLAMNAGALVLFRGRNSMHRVTPVAGDHTRILAVLAYNTKPGVSLSESARRTFYGRLG
ncbi:MAG: 2OG-Fe(II) oxygenase [Arenicellales bacterium]|nr:2OG-Fe(II) oxygenase [Arenicellales bacterium]